MSDSMHAPRMVVVTAPPLSPAEIESERLARLRPRDGTADAAREALRVIKSEKAAVAASLAQAQQAAADILINGQHHHIIAAREAVERAQITVEQVAALEQVTQDLVARRESAEAMASRQLQELWAEAEAKAALFRTFIAKRYGKLAAELAEGLALEGPALNAIRVFEDTCRTWPGLGRPVLPEMPRTEAGGAFVGTACLPGHLNPARSRLNDAQMHAQAMGAHVIY